MDKVQHYSFTTAAQQQLILCWTTQQVQCRMLLLWKPCRAHVEMSNMPAGSWSVFTARSCPGRAPNCSLCRDWTEFMSGIKRCEWFLRFSQVLSLGSRVLPWQTTNTSPTALLPLGLLFHLISRAVQTGPAERRITAWRLWSMAWHFLCVALDKMLFWNFRSWGFRRLEGKFNGNDYVECAVD